MAPPLIEFTESLFAGQRNDLPCKTALNSSIRLVVAPLGVRPDITLQVSRIECTLVESFRRDTSLPLWWFYALPNDLIGDRELVCKSAQRFLVMLKIEADLQIIDLAHKTLEVAGAADAVDLTHPAIMRALLKSYPKAWRIRLIR